MIGIVIFLIIVGVITMLVFTVTSSAIVFSRVAFALLAALVASQAASIRAVPNNGFLNYVAWAIIFVVLVMELSRFPKQDLALRFFCTIFMSTFIFGLIAALLSDKFEITLYYEIGMKVICLVIAVITSVLQVKQNKYEKPENIFVKVFERVLSALIYGCAITYFCISLHGNWELSNTVIGSVFFGTIIVSFLVDVYLEQRNSKIKGGNYVG